jgi:hypothetical protein
MRIGSNIVLPDPLLDAVAVAMLHAVLGVEQFADRVAVVDGVPEVLVLDLDEVALLARLESVAGLAEVRVQTGETFPPVAHDVLGLALGAADPGVLECVFGLGGLLLLGLLLGGLFLFFLVFLLLLFLLRFFLFGIGTA